MKLLANTVVPRLPVTHSRLTPPNELSYYLERLDISASAPHRCHFATLACDGFFLRCTPEPI
jgi:hypothetical protein